MSPLETFADELEAMALGLDAYRFFDSEKYVIDVTELRRAMRGMVDRMRRTASEKPNERLPLSSGYRATSRSGREVRVERRRVRPRR